MILGIGELFFSILFSYMGAIELIFVIKHLCHQIYHQSTGENAESKEESLKILQERIQKAIDEAENSEICGLNTMKDGILYKDGFRIDKKLLEKELARRGLSLDDFLKRNIKKAFQDDCAGQIVEQKPIVQELIGNGTTDHCIEVNEDAALRTDWTKHESAKVDDEYLGREEVIETPCVKKIISYIEEESCEGEDLESKILSDIESQIVSKSNNQPTRRSQEAQLSQREGNAAESSFNNQHEDWESQILPKSEERREFNIKQENIPANHSMETGSNEDWASRLNKNDQFLKTSDDMIRPKSREGFETSATTESSEKTFRAYDEEDLESQIISSSVHKTAQDGEDMQAQPTTQKVQSSEKSLAAHDEEDLESQIISSSVHKSDQDGEDMQAQPTIKIISSSVHKTAQDGEDMLAQPTTQKAQSSEKSLIAHDAEDLESKIISSSVHKTAQDGEDMLAQPTTQKVPGSEKSLTAHDEEDLESEITSSSVDKTAQDSEEMQAQPTTQKAPGSEKSVTAHDEENLESEIISSSVHKTAQGSEDMQAQPTTEKAHGSEKSLAAHDEENLESQIISSSAHKTAQGSEDMQAQPTTEKAHGSEKSLAAHDEENLESQIIYSSVHKTAQDGEDMQAQPTTQKAPGSKKSLTAHDEEDLESQIISSSVQKSAHFGEDMQAQPKTQKAQGSEESFTAHDEQDLESQIISSAVQKSAHFGEDMQAQLTTQEAQGSGKSFTAHDKMDLESQIISSTMHKTDQLLESTLAPMQLQTVKTPEQSVATDLGADGYDRVKMRHPMPNSPQELSDIDGDRNLESQMLSLIANKKYQSPENTQTIETENNQSLKNKQEMVRPPPFGGSLHDDHNAITPSEDYQELKKTQQTIKTQIGQACSQEYLPQEDHTSAAFASQDTSLASHSMPDINFDEYEREAPDGEDVPEPQYSDEYLRSLDGIKYRPLIRDDGSGRRRAFKKRLSTDSTSSRDSRASREEELKMFTSLEEEEFDAMKRGETSYEPIRYSSEPSLKVKKHHRRHRKSPVKIAKKNDGDADNQEPAEVLDDQDNSPWGEIKPEHYKDTEFWKREKTISIEEEDDVDVDAVQHLPTTETEAPVRKADMRAASAIRNIPKLSSFEEATDQQHETVLNILKQQSSLDAELQAEQQEKEVDQGSTGANKNVSRDANADDEAFLPVPEETHTACTDNQISHGTDAKRFIACGDSLGAANTDNNFTSGARVRRSPVAYESVAIYDNASDLLKTASENAQELKTRRLDQIESPSSELLDEDLKVDNISPLDPVKRSQPQTPKIEIHYAKDDGTMSVPLSSDLSEIELEAEKYEADEQPSDLMEGLSDFYDFNASINPSRSRSVSREKSILKSKTPTNFSRESSKEPTKQDVEDIISAQGASTDIGMESVGETAGGDEASGTTEISNEDGQSKSTQHQQAHPSKNGERPIDDEGGTGNIRDFNYPRSRSLVESCPATEDFLRHYSREQSDVERMKEEYRNNFFKRSTYVGESLDLADDYDDLREEARHFTRSRSKSRSISDDEENFHSSYNQRSPQSAIQQQILEEISKTTLNYQEFSRDNISQKYFEVERRGSDSALIPKPEILIQLQDECHEETDDDTMADMEAEEYHHFRRFSLNQECQVEEYPEENDHISVDQTEVQAQTGIRSWTREDYYDSEDCVRLNTNENSTVSIETVEDSDNGEAEEGDSGSEDDRQTVVEVEDEIEEDIMDYDILDDENEQSEGELDDNRNYDSRQYEGRLLENFILESETATGGQADNLEEDQYDDEMGAAGIDEIYDEAIKDRRESGIQRDYETILKEISEENNRLQQRSLESDETSSMRTEEFLDDILRDDAKQYHLRSYRSVSKHSTSSFLEEERNLTSYTSSSTVKLTRLRSRYGIGTASTSYISRDPSDSYTMETSPPKRTKEYNWRKNFKLDDDDETPAVSQKSRKLSFEEDDIQLETKSSKDSEKPNADYLDIRKFSLGGESITIYSRTPDRMQDFDIPSEYTDPLEVESSSEKEENIDQNDNQTIDILRQENFPIKITDLPEDKDTTELEGLAMPVVQSEYEKKSKKKRKLKKKNRKNSIEEQTVEEINENDNDSRRSSIEGADEAKFMQEETEIRKSPKKKLKKKKKSKDEGAILPQIDLSLPASEMGILGEEKEKEKEKEQSSRIISQEQEKETTKLEESLFKASTNLKQNKKEDEKSFQNFTERKTSSNPSTSLIMAEKEASTSSACSVADRNSNASGTEQKQIPPIKTTNPTPTNLLENTKNSDSKKSPVQRQESSGVYELIKDGSMYPWF